MERKTISAHEINKYTYCPYQWYYEKLYGRKELRRLYQARNEALGLESSAMSNFAKGLEFHKRYYVRMRLASLAWKIGVLLLILGGAVVYFWLKSGANV